MSAITASSPAPISGFPNANRGVPPLHPCAPKPVVGFHGAVSEFKRRLIEATLAQAGGNRTRAAKALGLQRTYLLRLMREFEIHYPAGRGVAGPVGHQPGGAAVSNTLTPGGARFEMRA